MRIKLHEGYKFNSCIFCNYSRPSNNIGSPSPTTPGYLLQVGSHLKFMVLITLKQAPWYVGHVAILIFLRF